VERDCGQCAVVGPSGVGLHGSVGELESERPRLGGYLVVGPSPDTSLLEVHAMSRAVIYEEFGGPEGLELQDVPEPHAGPREIRVRVAAVGLNPMDWGIAATPELAARFNITVPSGFGYDFAGVVDEVGDRVSGFAVGERVYGGVMERSAADHRPAVGRTGFGRAPDWEVLPRGRQSRQSSSSAWPKEASREANARACCPEHRAGWYPKPHATRLRGPQRRGMRERPQSGLDPLRGRSRLERERPSASVRRGRSARGHGGTVPRACRLSRPSEGTRLNPDSYQLPRVSANALRPVRSRPAGGAFVSVASRGSRLPTRDRSCDEPDVRRSLSVRNKSETAPHGALDRVR
jgi:hypothetical protein